MDEVTLCRAAFHPRAWQGSIAPMCCDSVDLASVSARIGHSSVRTTAEIYGHAIRGKNRAAAQC